MYLEKGGVMVGMAALLFISDFKMVILTDRESWSLLRKGTMLDSVPIESSPHFVFSLW